MSRYLFLALIALSFFVSPAIALFTGIVFALIFGAPFQKQTKKASKYLLQAAVVGLGFGINLHQSLQTGIEGMLFTIVSVVSVMVAGYFLGRWLKLLPRMSYLLSAGTAICGGSAIAAISPIVDADENETSVSLAVIFILNAVALFIFPPIGRLLEMTQDQFGMWAAIAIHDTSSVVGAAAEYGPQSVVIATMVKLTRALWIIPLSLVSIFIFRKKGNSKIAIPWFIFLFILAMVINTYFTIHASVLEVISIASHKFLSVSLFLIGSTLSIASIRKVGSKPVVLGILLWVLIAVMSLIVIL